LPTPERKKRITNPIKNKTADAPAITTSSG
jgi:hypothetical protein